MATIELTKKELVVRIRGWNSLYALRRTLSIQLGQVQEVRVRPTEADFDHSIIEGWRGIGTYMPRKLAAGVLHLRNGPSFLEVRDPQHTIAIDVKDVHVWGYRVNHLVLEIERESPEAAATRIVHAIERFLRGGTGRITAPPPSIPVPGPAEVAAELVANGSSTALGRY